MNKKAIIVVYILIILFFAIVIYMGAFSQQKCVADFKIFHHNSTTFDFLKANIKSPFAILLLQISVIILTSRIFGWLFKFIGQPKVIGEIAAGIFLGPSFLMTTFPVFGNLLFPSTSLIHLQLISNLGLIFFMFIIGMELEILSFFKKGHHSFFISTCSIVIPFIAGMQLGYFYYDRFAPAGISVTPFSLFMGISMCVTAFPVLARILKEKELLKTPIGNFAITVAAISDISAWFILAFVIAIVKSQSPNTVIFTFLTSLIYIILMFILIKPTLKKLGEIYLKQQKKKNLIIALVFLILLFSSFCVKQMMTLFRESPDAAYTICPLMKAGFFGMFISVIFHA